MWEVSEMSHEDKVREAYNEMKRYFGERGFQITESRSELFADGLAIFCHFRRYHDNRVLPEVLQDPLEFWREALHATLATVERWGVDYKMSLPEPQGTEHLLMHLLFR